MTVSESGEKKGMNIQTIEHLAKFKGVCGLDSIGRTDAKTEAPLLWPPDSKNRFIGKDPDAGKD